MKHPPLQGLALPGKGVPTAKQPPPVGDQDGAGWTIRLYHNPLAPWIWIGAVLCVLGGLVSLTDRRHRVGAPQRQRKLAVAPAE